MTREISTRLLKPRNNYFVMGCSPTHKIILTPAWKRAQRAEKNFHPHKQRLRKRHALSLTQNRNIHRALRPAWMLESLVFSMPPPAPVSILLASLMDECVAIKWQVLLPQKSIDQRMKFSTAIHLAILVRLRVEFLPRTENLLNPRVHGVRNTSPTIRVFPPSVPCCDERRSMCSADCPKKSPHTPSAW